MIDYREVLKRRRKERGISQNKLAQVVGITQTFMSEIESGRKAPSLDVFFRLCDALEIPLFPSENKSDV